MKPTEFLGEKVEYAYPGIFVTEQNADFMALGTPCVELGQWIADAINEKLERERMHQISVPFSHVEDHVKDMPKTILTTTNPNAEKNT